MSIQRECKITLENEEIRYNFADEEAEAEFHAQEYISEAGKRKATPIYSGVLNYFPDAIAEVARVSRAGNDQHNPGSELHWDRSKSGDELDALARHLMDAGTYDSDGMRHSAKVAWRALANLQKEIENDGISKAEDIASETFASGPCSMYELDGICNGELGAHPLCSTDFCPCKEEEIERRMNIIGQNGNDGLHYDKSLSAYPESNWTETKSNEV